MPVQFTASEGIATIAAAGADTFVAGSAIFGARGADGSYRDVVAAMRGQLEPLLRKAA